VAITNVTVKCSILALTACTTCPTTLAVTDDPDAPHQHHLAGVDAAAAWARTRGDGIVVAIIDNGFDAAHPDLRPRLWANPGETAGDGVDNDDNGFVDDVQGWDFLDDDADTSITASPALNDALRAHGTAAAGIVAAEADNGIATAGACPRCTLMLLRARDFERARTVMPLLPAAIRYAVAHGADVISISDGRFAADVSAELDAEIVSALAEAEAMGVVVVASAGNDGARGVRLPAAYPTVMAVASVGPELAPSATTSHGPEVDVAAPGECVRTLDVDAGTRDFAGTSAAAPIVAALAALVMSAEPSLDPAAVRARIRETATPIDLSDSPELEGRMGTGVVSFGEAVR
jgi:subtilisin family serine protease